MEKRPLPQRAPTPGTPDHAPPRQNKPTTGANPRAPGPPARAPAPNNQSGVNVTRRCQQEGPSEAHRDWHLPVHRKERVWELPRSRLARGPAAIFALSSAASTNEGNGGDLLACLRSARYTASRRGGGMQLARALQPDPALRSSSLRI